MEQESENNYYQETNTKSQKEQNNLKLNQYNQKMANNNKISNNNLSITNNDLVNSINQHLASECEENFDTLRNNFYVNR
jgi:hypothetical protein